MRGLCKEQREQSGGAVGISLCSNPRGLQSAESGDGYKEKAGTWQALGRHSRNRVLLVDLPERKRPLGISELERNTDELAKVTGIWTGAHGLQLRVGEIRDLGPPGSP